MPSDETAGQLSLFSERISTAFVSEKNNAFSIHLLTFHQSREWNLARDTYSTTDWGSKNWQSTLAQLKCTWIWWGTQRKPAGSGWDRLELGLHIITEEGKHMLMHGHNIMPFWLASRTDQSFDHRAATKEAAVSSTPAGTTLRVLKLRRKCCLGN